jgi:predicted transcriptional regulator of viral defense system
MSRVLLEKYRSLRKINYLSSSVDRTQVNIFENAKLIKDCMKVAEKSLHCRSKFCYCINKFDSID